MLGREAIGDCAGFVSVGGDDDQAVAGERLASDGIVAAARLCFGDDIFGEVGARGDEDGERFGIVLGLRDEVGGDVWLRSAALAGDDDLGGAGEHVDGAVKGDETLGGSDVEVAGADDLVDTRKELSSVGQRSHGVHATDPIELGDAEQVGGRESFRRGLGRDDDDARARRRPARELRS